MARAKTAYVCAECGASALQWFGSCPSCGAAGSLSETVMEKGSTHRYAGAAANSIALQDIKAHELERLPTGVSELDRALGGGLVAGQVALLGGDPGIGKSTLLLQTLSCLSTSVLYVTGEESVEQVALRARRLALDAGGVRLLAETQLERVIAALESAKPRVAVVDSIQTLWSETLQSAPGSVAQVRECAAQLTRHAKRAGTALFMIGHVTKEGAIAGPRVLEHIVDTVLYFEGDAHSAFRLVRAVKNRFGAVNELGVFAMTDKGLKGVSNPSRQYL
jgi:DNA repair protein RadA/Sms